MKQSHLLLRYSKGMISKLALILALLVPVPLSDIDNISLVYKPYLLNGYYKSKPIYSPTETDVKAIVVWKESRGESVATQKAVLDVVDNRMRLYGMTAYEVVKQQGAFPWAKHNTQWKASKKQLDMLDVVSYTDTSISKDTVYFNTVPHSFGKNTRKIGNLYFGE